MWKQLGPGLHLSWDGVMKGCVIWYTVKINTCWASVLLMFAKSSTHFSLANDKNSVGGVAYQSCSCILQFTENDTHWKLFSYFCYQALIQADFCGGDHLSEKIGAQIN